MSISHKLFNKHKRLKSGEIYSQEDINKVMFNLPNMSVIIGEFTPLRKSGKDYVGRCPICRPITKNNFHFRVSDWKKRYKCFECGVAGNNAVSFLMQYFKSPFSNMLRFVNKIYAGQVISPKRIRSQEKSNIDDDLPF
jgi:DNA primase